MLLCLSVHWLWIHRLLSCHRISGTMNQPLSDNKSPEPKGLWYLLCSSQTPLLRTYVPSASLSPQTSQVHTANQNKSKMRFQWFNIPDINSAKGCSTSCLAFSLPPMSITDAMFERLKGDWFSQRRNENIVAVEPLPYENITTLFPAYTKKHKM